MVMQTKFDSLSEISALQSMASSVEEPVFLRTPDSHIMVDAKSFLGLFTLDFSHPVEVVTDSLYVIRRLEIMSRRKAAAAVR
ncbi:MAG TPA: hypothetical protein H9839_06885 [Candidatus Intestinimonas stercorigallinarum]|nr:hypothetical protein [Candidatus Intestinimonas stercorigallinarum]